MVPICSRLAARRHPSNRRVRRAPPNLTPAARRYLERLGLGVEDLFHHVLAVLHDPAYREANAGALRMEWPRIPLPGWTELSVIPVAPSVIPVKTGIQGPQRPAPEDFRRPPV